MGGGLAGWKMESFPIQHAGPAPEDPLKKWKRRKRYASLLFSPVLLHRLHPYGASPGLVSFPLPRPPHTVLLLLHDDGGVPRLDEMLDEVPGVTLRYDDHSGDPHWCTRVKYTQKKSQKKTRRTSYFLYLDECDDDDEENDA